MWFAWISLPSLGWEEKKKRIDTRDASQIYYLAGRWNKQSLTVEAELSCAHTCNIPHVLSKTKKNAKHLFQSWENLIGDGAYVCYSDWTRSRTCLFFFRLRGKENVISSVIYRKKTKHSNISMFVRKKEKDE